MTITTDRSWETASRPDTPEGWVRRAEEVAAVLASDAVQRDQANEAPFAEVALLKRSGLVTLLGPPEHGGGGADWVTAYRVTREIAKADGSIGQLLGYHYLWNWLPRFWGTREQWERLEAEAAREQWLFGGAVNPRDDDLVVRDAGDHLVFNGRKSFSTGGRVTDVIVLEGVLEGTEDHVFAIVPSDSPGVVRNSDWDNIGQRLSESGSVELHDVRAEWKNALGYVDKKFQPRVYNTLTTPAIQLVFVNLYLGIAQGALQTAVAYTRTKTRAWLHGVTDDPLDDPYILATYGDLASELYALEALVDKAGEEIQRVHDDPDALTERRRGEVAVLIAAAKIRSTRVALDVTSRIFEVTGARSTASALGLDRFWRNVRTHTLHDPVAYKLRELGVYVLRDEIPQPTWYS
ncbi:monooxygenase [Carbonactinospora thermoautotrophica]|uniref:Monooxygenase n=1 Tax=Carbonactinospora thermoautotrophica TaxID=1469144 RepID=A0A132MXQ8_9ACTN|nr:acyl-CoA dehydrogenase family protein [Carbonactinospora thermoautotrophica]KWX02152.1 FMNH2-dependent monooxygenase [Carbonactinospora thermoautotrophica]KWX03372.1 monooxygenase [Carbonactinospora thermoautotrophica]KWX06345.1 monooxygenase [Carbonactinospora thermoautotrophica]